MKEYFMNKIKEQPYLNALFFNKLDIKKRSDEEEFLIVGEVILEEFKGDDSVRYYFNSLGYRSDEFTDLHDGEHILFAGCSETEGYGGNLDTNWAYIMYTELAKKKKLSGFFNLSSAAWGHETITNNIMRYIESYGKPDKIYMLLPNIARKYEWEGTHKNREHYAHKLKTPYYVENHISEWFGEPRLQQTLEEQRSDIVRFTILLRMFEEYCISNGIDLIWSSWSEPDAINYKNLNVFKKFVLVPYKAEVLLESKSFVVDKDKEKYLIRKRDWHHGYLYHYLWAQTFLNLVDTNDV
jgi:hypothetical protein